MLTRHYMLLLSALWTTCALFTLSPHAYAADQLDEQRATNAFLERFTKFAQDRNVMGRPKTADGKLSAGGGPKKTSNRDDVGLFQSDLTYHDLSFNTIEEDNSKDGKGKVARLFAFVSPHGAIPDGGGSSELERRTYNLHKKFTKADEEANFKNDDEKSGIKFRSIFKITTQEVDKKDANGKAVAKNDPSEEPDKVERFELRDEAKTDLTKVGDESFESVRRAARDEGNENDNDTLSNGVRLRWAGAESVVSWWRSQLANLVQRRVNRGIRAGEFPDTPQLSERTNSCANWQGTATSVLANVKDPERRKELEQEVGRMTQQCAQLGALPFDKIDPRFEPDKEGKDQLVVKGPDKEDATIRDSRVQLQAMDSVRTGLKSIPSNWKYAAVDEEAVLTDFDDNGKANGERRVTMAKQLDNYNGQLRDSVEAIAEVQKRMPGYKVDTDAILAKQVQDGNAAELNSRFAAQALADETGETVQTERIAKTYNDLQQDGVAGPQGAKYGPPVPASVSLDVSLGARPTGRGGSSVQEQ